MLIVAKVALGLGVTAAMAGAWVLHEGVIRVDVDEHRDNGTHLHLLLPATLVSAGIHLVPQEKIQCTARNIRSYLPLIREVSKELEKYPNAELVDVDGDEDRIRITMTNGKLRIDAVSQDGDLIHISVPARLLGDVADQLEEKAPGF